MEKQIHYLEVQLRNKNNDLLHLQDEIYKLSKNDNNNNTSSNNKIGRRISSTSSISSFSNSKRSKSVTPSTSSSLRSKKVTKTPNYIKKEDIMSSESVINEFEKNKEYKNNKNDDDDDDIKTKLKRIHNQLNTDPYYNYYQKISQSFPFPPYPPYPPSPYPPSFPPYVCKSCEEKSRIEADLKSIILFHFYIIINRKIEWITILL